MGMIKSEAYFTMTYQWVNTVILAVLMKKAKDSPEAIVVMLWLSNIRNYIPIVDPYQQSKHKDEVARQQFYMA